MLLASLNNTKDFLEIKSTSFDDLLGTLLIQISKRIETFLNRDMEKLARTVYYNAGRKTFFLPAYPIDLTAALTVVYSNVAQVLNTDYFIWDDEGLIEFYSKPVYNQPREIVISWTGGYADTAAVPADVQMAAILQTAFVFRRRNDVGLNSITLPDGSISVHAPTELLPEVKAVLKSYRRLPGVR